MCSKYVVVSISQGKIFNFPFTCRQHCDCVNVEHCDYVTVESWHWKFCIAVESLDLESDNPVSDFQLCQLG